MISVLMPVYNNAAYLRESIDSILNQTYIDFEFIIVDDGSTEQVWNIIESYTDPRIIKIKNDDNIGLTKSLNICLKKASGDFMARQDSDDISVSTRFEDQINNFSDNIGLVTSYGYAIDENGKRIPHSYLDNDSRVNSGDILKGNYLVGASAMFRKEVFEKIGFYDEELYLAQDYNYWIRILKFFKVKIVPKDLYLVRKHKNNVRILHTEYYGFDWSKKCKERAEECPIIS